MKVNFEIEDNIAVLYEGHHIDVHNNFDFIGIFEDSENKEIKLEFRKSAGDWVKEDEFESLTFILMKPNYKYFEEGESGSFPEDSKCLGNISFFSSEHREINDSIVPQTVPKESDDLIFLFEDGRIIRINCEEAKVIVNQIAS